MAPFDESKKYQAKGDGVFFDDGREIELLHYVYSLSNLDQIRGSPQHVLAAIDSYARTQKYLMNIGEHKGEIITQLIADVKPRVMVELGGYVGYSTILFADALAKAGGTTYFCCERNPEFAAVIASLVDLAGLSSIVKVVVGASDASIRRLASSGTLKHIDLLFLDHYKPAYTTDLKLCEELGLIKANSVLAADNVITPGNPPYLEYVRSSVEEKHAAMANGSSTNCVDSRFSDRTSNQYKSRDGEGKLNHVAVGKPDLVYESKLVHSYEPSGEADGVEITRCVAVSPSISWSMFPAHTLHIVRNASLIFLSILFLPLDTLILVAALLIRATLSPFEKEPHGHSHKLRRVLVTGVGMNKGLLLARIFFESGHIVIGADVEPTGALGCGRASKAIDAFHRLPDTSAADGSEQYIQALLHIIRKERIDLWVSCSGVASALEDGKAQEAVERAGLCKVIQFDAPTTQLFHEKDSFIRHVSSLGLVVPETHTITSRAEVKRLLANCPRGRKFIAKPIGMDDASRGDMTLLPLKTSLATDRHISRLKISDKLPWILQQYVSGSEYCTYSVVVRGRVKAFVACPSSELLMHYEALPRDSALSRAMLEFTETVAAHHGPSFTGHLSFDFLVKDGQIVLYPIECNPRCHTAVVLFRSDAAALARAYLSVLDDASDETSDQAQKVVMPTAENRTYWAGHDLVTLFLLPLVAFIASEISMKQLLAEWTVFLRHLIYWRDGAFEIWDPLPWWWLYHVYWPMQFWVSIRSGKEWSRINVSTTKMFLF